jgi:hypothetical protein
MMMMMMEGWLLMDGWMDGWIDGRTDKWMRTRMMEDGGWRMEDEEDGG